MPPKNENRKPQILEVTESLFRRGVGQHVTIEDVARVAGISKGTIYLYFADKEELFFQAELYRMEQLVQLLRDEILQETEFFDRLVVTFQKIESFFRDRVPILPLHKMIGAAPSPEVDKRRAEWREARSILDRYLTELMNEGITRGILRADVDPAVAARQFMAILKSRRLDIDTAQEFMPTVEETLSLFVFGIVDATQKHRRLLARAEEHAEL